MEIFEKKKNVQGWITKNEARALFELARNVKGEGVIIEIGSWKGRSTICLALGSKSGSLVNVFAIDPHVGSPEIKKFGDNVDTYNEFFQNIKNSGADDIITPIRKTSEAAAKHFNEDIELLFIDGVHRYEMVLKDFQLWAPRLVKGGMIAFHDSKRPGPRKVILRRIILSKYYRILKITDSLTVAVKDSKSFFRILSDLIIFIKEHYIKESAN